MTGRALPTRIAAVVSDVDGTLVRSDKALTPRTIETVAQLRGAGIPFAIVSSRPPRGLTTLIERLEITTFAAGFNGGVIARPDLSIVADHLIAPEVARHAIPAIEAAGAVVRRARAGDRARIKPPGTLRWFVDRVAASQ